ncbi:50S ribosomal protein L25 [Planctomicrobium sp. SH664]|uniref:50S ribosomal protein L25 n=1 Tax=Planctomicrobium sp. SH664 TaxID=3448125 RepID=UPI003F5B381D
MSTIVKIAGKTRSEKGTAAMRRLRAQGLVPANVYGHKQDAVAIAMDVDTVSSLVKSGARVIELDVDGKVETALVKDLQWDTFSLDVLHVDFVRVDSNERVRVDVPVQLRGTAPGVVAGGVLELPHHTVTVECLAVDVPDSLQVKIGHLNVGDYLHVRDLTELPAGVVVVNAPETILVHIAQPKAAPEVGAADAAAPAAEAGKPG